MGGFDKQTKTSSNQMFFLLFIQIGILLNHFLSTYALTCCDIELDYCEIHLSFVFSLKNCILKLCLKVHLKEKAQFVVFLIYKRHLIVYSSHLFTGVIF